MANRSVIDSLKRYFYQAINLKELADTPFNVLQKKAPSLSRGWYELSMLEDEERIDLIRDFWIQRLKEYPGFCRIVEKFFDNVTDVEVFLIQRSVEDPFEVHMIYIVDDNESCFHGYPPASEDEIIDVENEFLGDILPRDWLSFLEIHNGFFKTTDSTGVFPSTKIKEQCNYLQMYFGDDEEVVYSTDHVAINPKRLIPFYKSFGMPYYQCFWADWYPKEEMGNVYCSLSERCISEVNERKTGAENMSFATFGEWLSFYLDRL